MASATRGTPWAAPLHCRPSASFQSRLPSSSLRCTPISTRVRRLTASASAAASFTAVKPNSVQSQREGPEGFPDGEDETVKRALNPSIQYANIMRFKGPYNVQIFVDEAESEDSITNRFRREVLREGILQECKRRRYHETRQDIKKRKGKDALKRARNGRARRALRRKREENEDDDGDDEDDEDDNWQLPEEDIGF